MFRLPRWFLAASLVGAGLGGCGGEGGTDANGVDAGPAAAQEVRSEKKQETNPNVPDADYADLVAGNTGFGMQLYQRLSGAQANLFYSPLSISVALAMTWAGARGTSEAQLAKALQFTLPQSALHPAMNKLILQMAARNVLPHQTPEGTKAVRVNLTNALWAQTGYQFVPAYLDALAVSYDAGVKLLDFSSDPDAAGEVINLWVAQQTEDKIKDLIPPGSLSPVTRLVLTNTLYFYGSSGGSVGRDSFVGQSG